MDGSICRLVSVIVPFRDEEGNAEPFCARLFRTLSDNPGPWEVFLVDDGSRDGTLAALGRGVSGASVPVTVLSLRRPAGQTAALQAGLDRCHGGIVVTLDGDLQNDPAEIPRILAALGEDPRAPRSLDFVAGWRADRRDPFWRRVVPSRVANALLRRFFRVPFHDVGCGLRAFRRDLFLRTRLFGQMHRFLPLIAFWKGARVGEVAVAHGERRWGRAKYGLSRLFRMAGDLAAARFVAGVSARPLVWLGPAALAAFSGSALVGMTVLAMKTLRGADITGNPLFYLSILLFVVSVNLFALGLAGEWAVLIYAETLSDTSYARVDVVAPPRTSAGAREQG